MIKFEVEMINGFTPPRLVLCDHHKEAQRLVQQVYYLTENLCTITPVKVGSAEDNVSA